MELLLHLAPTCADAGPDLCTLHPELATYCGGLSPSAVGTKALFTHVMVSPIATYATGADTKLTLGQLNCMVAV